MTLKRVGIERPDFLGLDDAQQQYLSVLETMAFAPKQQEELKNPFDPRSWPISTHIAIVTVIVTAFLWAFNSGGEWKQVESRIAAIEARQAQYETVYARRDLLEQQMGYVVQGLNELKVKVDQLTASSKR